MTKVVRRGIALILCALMLLPLLASVSFAAGETVPEFNVDVEVAAEDALLRGATTTISDTNATGGMAVKLNAASGERGNQSTLLGNETVNLSMKFIVSETDTYRLRIRCLAKDAGCDSVWINVNGSEQY